MQIHSQEQNTDLQPSLAWGTQKAKHCALNVLRHFLRVIYTYWPTGLDAVSQHRHGTVFSVFDTAAPRQIPIQCLSNRSWEELQTYIHTVLGVAEPPGLLFPKALATHNDHRTNKPHSRVPEAWAHPCCMVLTPPSRSRWGSRVSFSGAGWIGLLCSRYQGSLPVRCYNNSHHLHFPQPGALWSMVCCACKLIGLLYDLWQLVLIKAASSALLLALCRQEHKWFHLLRSTRCQVHNYELPLVRRLLPQLPLAQAELEEENEEDTQWQSSIPSLYLKPSTLPENWLRK